MSTESTKPEANKCETRDIEIELTPEGTFAGNRENPVEIEEDERVPEDTGDQGGGQN